MKLRTQLALTFLALTILPLGGLAGYSYYTSSNAVRTALEEEAADLAREMDGKLDVAREWVAGTIANVEPISFDSLVSDDRTTEDRVARRIIRDMGSAAPLVSSFEFVPSDFTPSEFAFHSGNQASGLPEPPEAPVTPEVPDADAPPVPSPAAPEPPKIVIDIRKALEEVEKERETLDQAPVAAESLGFAVKVIESVPFQMIMEQSMTAMRTGLAEAEESLAEEEAALAAAELDPEIDADEEQLEEKRQAIAAARQALDSLRNRKEETAAEIERRQQRRTESVERQRDEIADQQRREAREDRQGIHRTAPSIPVVQDGQIVGSVKADVHEEEILREIFLSTAAQGNEIPFAIDEAGEIYTRSPEEAASINVITLMLLQDEEVNERIRSSDTVQLVHEGWIVATSRDEESGLVIGVVRPATEAIAEVRRATFRSLGLGLALVGICLIGVLPLANHMTRDIAAVTAGAERISDGDLDSQVEVKSRNEVGRLATVFNRMASDLRTNQQRLVEEETARREQEIREQLLQNEYDRTAAELDAAREFQLSMLPSSLPQIENLDLAVEMTTATEVGGDYYDFHPDETGLTIAIGDGTGHGAKAGTMVAVIKSLFTALSSSDLRGFLREASATIRTMQLGRMSMALTLLRIEEGRLGYACAGMPPVLLCRTGGGETEELATPGAPLGTIDFPYEERDVVLSPGDTIITMSDGLPEMLDQSGEPFGYERVGSVVRAVQGEPPEVIIHRLQRAAIDWRGDHPQNDDMTILVVRYLGRPRLRESNHA